jgi:recombination protein RecT
MEQKKFDLKTISGFSSTIVNYHSSIGKFLNPRYGITPEDFIETCIRAVKENPKLLQCDPKSLFGAVLLSAEVGLKPNTSLQHSFIIPYKGQAKFQIGYKGLIEIMYRNPRVKQITARAVFENDEFDYGYGLKPFLTHKPARKDKGILECVYATCLVDDEPIFVVVERAELDAIRNISQTIDSQYSPYNNGTDVHNWMEIKAGIKSLSKLIPTSNNIEMAKAVEYDSKFEGGARVLVDIPTNPNEIVEPKFVEGNVVGKMIDTAFDFIEEVESETPKTIIVQDEEEEQSIAEKLQNFKLSKQQEEISVKQDIIPVKQEVPVQEKAPIMPPVETFKQEVEPVKQDNFEWELPNVTTDSLDENDNTDVVDDISFNFPDNDEDDEDDNPSTLF